MSIYERSAQFAPYDALEGYMDSVKETSRITSKRIEITEEVKSEINDKLNSIQRNIVFHPKVKITYFIKDNKKSGGCYKEIECNIKKIDTINNELILINNNKIPIKEIINIE